MRVDDAQPDCMATELSGVYHEPHSPHGEMIHFAFRCELSAAEQTPAPDLKEISELGYWPVEALPRPISDFTVRRITDALRRAGKLLPTTISERQWLE